MTEPQVPRRAADGHVLSGAYVLDALEQADRAAFEEHLRDCALCQRDVLEFRDTLAGMKELVGQQPPPELRASVLRRIRGTPQLPPERD